MAVDKRITNSEGAGVSTHRGVRAYGNSHGFLAAYPGTVHSLSCAVLGAEGDEMERDYWYSTARDWRELEDAKSVGRTAGERAVRRLGARQLGTMKVPVLYTPDVARGLISHFIGAIRAAASTACVVSCSTPPGSRCSRNGSRCPSDRTLRARSPARRSITKAWATSDRELVSGGVLLGLRAEHLLGPQARAADHRQRRRHAQPVRALPRARLRRDAGPHGRACW